MYWMKHLIFLMSGVLMAQEAAFRSETRVVNVSAIVRGDKPVTGLSAENFRLKIDGKEKAIRYFQAGSGQRRPLALMIYFNLAPEGAMRQLSQAATQEGFAAALGRLHEADEVAVYAVKDWFVGQPKLVAELGRDRAASAAALVEAVRGLGAASVVERQAKEKTMGAAVESAVSLAAARPDLQVALVYISDGMNPLDTMLTRERNPLVKRLMEHNISFSALNLDMKGSYAAAAAALNPLGKVMGFSVSGFGDGFAKQTGGLSIDVREPERLGEGLEEVVTAYAGSYSLGYQCEGEEYVDGKWHKLEVFVKGVEGKVTVSSRKRFRF
jgi:VWFA-related protein